MQNVNRFFLSQVRPVDTKLDWYMFPGKEVQILFLSCVLLRITGKYLLMVYFVTSPVLFTGDRTVSGSGKVPDGDNQGTSSTG